MWVVGDTLMLPPMIPLAIEWMHLEERRTVRIDQEVDAAAGTPTPRPEPLRPHHEGADHALLRVTRNGAEVRVGPLLVCNEADRPLMHPGRRRVTEEPQRRSGKGWLRRHHRHR